MDRRTDRENAQCACFIRRSCRRAWTYKRLSVHDLEREKKSAGRKEALGRPILYGTTDNFLAHFGISSLKELPPMPEKPKGDWDDAEMTDDVPELIP